MEKDVYKTIEKPSEEILFKDRNSKFFGYAFPIASEEEAKGWIDHLKKEHHSARHWCYAYQIGFEEKTCTYRANDDGEPNNSAGMPIYGQIQSFGITNVLIVVVRYFGGTKLGVGGLINAYRTAAKMALEVAEIVCKTINVKLQITFGYQEMSKVMRLVKAKQLEIVSQNMEIDCELLVLARKKEMGTILTALTELQGVEARVLND
ncbi:MAG TPA: YigZ family protein [Aquaticitalea sp.]|nr:YigZ family protein [Aquaticitalea sp.]HNU58939.1 YigZ family protein [Aquaticitalea sp.]